MPDTHLAMPWSLPADQARTLEATFQAPMTTSDASPNGTAAAAAAFARLLASGDQAMQSETKYSDKANTDEHTPLSLRDILLGTVSPFADLLQTAKAESLAHWPDGVDMVYGDQLKAAQAPWTRFHAMAPSTPILSLSDVIAAITQARAELEMEPNEGTDALFRSIGLLRRVQEAAQAFPVGETSIIPSIAMTFRQAADPALAAYLEWVTAANEVNRTADEASKLPKGSPEWEAANEACHKAEELSDDLMEVVVKSTATSPAGVLAKFAYFTWITSSSMTQGDIKLWSGMIADIARLGVFPLESKEVAPFGEGRRFSPLHRAAMAKEGIDPSGRSVALPSSLWEPPADLPHPDAALLSAWDEYVRVSSAFDALPLGTSDEAAEPLACELDACRDRMEGIPATTLEGVLLKLRYLFAALMESPDAIDAAIYGKPASAELLHPLSLDCRERMLWNMIQPSIGAREAINDQRPGIDAFADSVTAFETEAPATLALPLEPTGRMVDAGATAAGITPEQFQAAYAAAVEALQKERAA